MADRFYTSIFNGEFEIEISIHIFSFFLLEQKGVQSLDRVFLKCLKHVEKEYLKMAPLAMCAKFKAGNFIN